MKRSDTFAIHNAKVSELGQEILSEQRELRKLTPKINLLRGTYFSMYQFLRLLYRHGMLTGIMHTQFKIRCRGVIVHEGKLMLVRNMSKEGPRDFYTLPGGHLEFGEDPETCIARELLEELGVEAKIGKLLFVHTHVKNNDSHAVEFFFEVLNGVDFLNHEEMQKTHAYEIAEVRWIERGERVHILPESFAEHFHTDVHFGEATQFIS